MTPVQEHQAPLKHSGPGIASFILGLLSILAAIVAFVAVFAGIADYITADGTFAPPESNEELVSIPAIAIGVLLFFLGILLSVVGVVLGIIGCVLPNRRRVFAILGLVFSSLVSAGIILMIVIGLLLQ